MNKLIKQTSVALLMTGIIFPVQALAVQPDISMTSSLLKTTGMLLVVIALIYGLGWLMRKIQKPQHQHQKHLSLIETLPLGRNERLCLVKSGEHYLVLGITPQGINRIDEIQADAIDNTAPANSSWQWAQQILHRH